MVEGITVQFQRLIYGQSSERFADDPDQGCLPFAAYPSMEKDRERAQVVLGYIQQLFAVEREAREEGLLPGERKELRPLTSHH